MKNNQKEYKMDYTEVDLSKLSAKDLDELSIKAKRLAAHLRAEEPSYDLAIEAGIRNTGYSTVRWGWVSSYSGRVEITMDNGKRWRALGYGPRGNAETVSAQGGIKFEPIE
jgi:hypothetical protein